MLMGKVVGHQLLNTKPSIFLLMTLKLYNAGKNAHGVVQCFIDLAKTMNQLWLYSVVNHLLGSL